VDPLVVRCRCHSSAGTSALAQKEHCDGHRPRDCSCIGAAAAPPLLFQASTGSAGLVAGVVATAASRLPRPS
jgi:hypothetical protein